MTDRICSTLPTLPGFRALIVHGNEVQAVPISGWGLTPTSTVPHPLRFSGERIDTAPGYLGIAEPHETTAQAMDRIGTSTADTERAPAEVPP